MAGEPATGPVAIFCADLRELLRGSGRTAVGLASELRMSRGQVYAILNGEVKRPPDFTRVVEPMVRACGADEAEVAQWRKRHDVLEQVYEELRRQHRRTAVPPEAAEPPVEMPAPEPAEPVGPAAPPRRRRGLLVLAAVGAAVLVAAVSSLVTARLVDPVVVVAAGSPCIGPAPSEAGADLLDVPHAPPNGDPHLDDWWRNDRGIAELAFARHGFAATVHRGTTNRWALLVARGCLPVVAGERYALSFTASASVPVTIGVRVQDSRPPDYTPSLDRTADLTATARTWTFEFAGATTYTASELLFQFGGSPDLKVRFDDVRLVMVEA